MQYWTPPGHNAWVGDVATLFHAGRYHVFYLYDRRHHRSKFGKGAHYFEHLSTADFKISRTSSLRGISRFLIRSSAMQSR